ncbi:Acetate kinase [Cupriavidus taiwanensis]|uniref:Acetate kinase n=1 Tax=Cupriavidus taiwanensis TaxID=164546 RepID=A0A375ECJ6_9BURK|nr:acetate/propionate family kinase [Cupriavidus taiwanensis]SOZ66403.1 Acetate kinase [Cupriavidus taiwanensis]SOZ67204.1 Acetate kinase [Cupriavidus taiwanensis]SOZ70734.1 Acetate kinase [Cupriavidus taiwanensis]SPA02173.1 Acetate kinase [Cupriavidus taiwanensis]SPA08886.1 Acetate kinase [Cupriavidus taiwanensis]
MAEIILVLNAGSSSLKYCAYDVHDNALRLVLRGSIEGLYTAPAFHAVDAAGAEVEARQWGAGTQLGHEGAIAYLADFLRGHGEGHTLAAVGHRVVHGGVRFTQPERVTDALLAELDTLCPLAPLHQPHNLKAIRILAERRPALPQVACFDTAFHRAQPEVAQAFALPAEITGRGVRRYGFHGLSYEYIASVLPRIDAAAAAGRTVVAHLGNGSSMCALVAGRSVASTMGFTAVDGLPMGTRCGSLDPGVILYLIGELGMDAGAIEDLIYRKSGLLGMSGVSSDMRALLASDDARARFAVEVYTYRIARELGSLAAAAQGLDALVFTAGIGEHAAPVRERVCRQAAWLGVSIDAAANARNGPRISEVSGRVPVWVIPTDEELMIARHTREIIATPAP